MSYFVSAILILIFVHPMKVNSNMIPVQHIPIDLLTIFHPRLSSARLIMISKDCPCEDLSIKEEKEHSEKQ